MDPTEFERMDSARRKIRSMAVVLLDSLGADHTITNLNLVEDNLFEAGELLITAMAEHVAERYEDGGPDADPTDLNYGMSRTVVREPDEQAILGRDR